LLITLDTARADHISCYGYKRLTTPHLDEFAREGVLYKNAYATAPWTLPSHATIFTGKYTARHGADHNSQAFAYYYNEAKKGKEFDGNQIFSVSLKRAL
jgi:arylsulfatase A-like enzyme